MNQSLRNQPTLLQFVSLLDPFVRSHVNSLLVIPSSRGYLVEARLSLWRGDDPHRPTVQPSYRVEPLEGVRCTSVSRVPDISGTLTWETPIWEQIVDLVRDREMSAALNLGTMHGTEESYVTDGVVATAESGQYWHIATHGRPRSPEREAWMRWTKHNPWL